jgi:diguanylate cyclase (GGDEF)-like protein
MDESKENIYTQEEIEFRKLLFSFAKIHENVLGECRKYVDGSLVEVRKKFFEYLYCKDEFSEIRAAHPELEKYSKTLTVYIKSLFSGGYDEEYAAKRAEIVTGNIQNGVPFKFYQSFVFIIKNILVDVISRKAGGSPSVFAISGALDRLLMFELSIAYDVYLNYSVNDVEKNIKNSEITIEAPALKPNNFAMAYFKVAAKNKELQEAIKRESGKNPFAMAYFKVASKIPQRTSQKNIIRDRNMNPMVLAYYKVVNRARELQEMNRRDALTGLYNRTVLKNFLQRNISFSRRILFPLSVGFFDVDNFKQINDTLGHQKGDELLMTIGGVLTGTMRDVDRAFRFGGDEFCVVFPGTSAMSACSFFKRTMEGIQAIFPDVTISVGISQTGPHVFHEVDDLIRRADILMYEAKKVKGFHIEYDSEGSIPYNAEPEILVDDCTDIEDK